MKVHTLWKCWDDDCYELIAAVDEAVDEAAPEVLDEARAEGLRELVLVFNGDALEKLFAAHVVQAKAVEE